MDRGDKLAQFVSLTDADPEFASSFLEASGWNVETAVANFLDAAGHAPSGSGGGGRGPGGHSSHGGGSRGSGRSHESGWGEDEVRAAMDTRVEQLVGGAVGAGPRAGGAAVAYVPQVHSAFRNFEAERSGEGSSSERAQSRDDREATVASPLPWVPLIVCMRRFRGRHSCRNAAAKGEGGCMPHRSSPHDAVLPARLPPPFPSVQAPAPAPARAAAAPAASRRSWARPWR